MATVDDIAMQSHTNPLQKVSAKVCALKHFPLNFDRFILPQRGGGIFVLFPAKLKSRSFLYWRGYTVERSNGNTDMDWFIIHDQDIIGVAG